MIKIVRGTSWYQPAIPVTPVVVGTHTMTKLYELKTAMDPRRGEWRCNLRVSTDAARVEIGDGLVAFEGRRSMRTQTHRQTDI